MSVQTRWQDIFRFCATLVRLEVLRDGRQTLGEAAASPRSPVSVITPQAFPSVPYSSATSPLPSPPFEGGRNDPRLLRFRVDELEKELRLSREEVADRNAIIAASADAMHLVAAANAKTTLRESDLSGSGTLWIPFVTSEGICCTVRVGADDTILSVRELIQVCSHSGVCSNRHADDLRRFRIMMRLLLCALAGSKRPQGVTKSDIAWGTARRRTYRWQLGLEQRECVRQIF